MASSLIQNQKEQVRSLLDGTSSVGIIIGQNQNIDTFAAALGLYVALQAEGKSVQIVSAKEPTVEVSSLVGIDHVSKSFDGVTKTLTISVPYREGEIEKVSYNIEGDRLNVNLFAENTGITFSEKDVEYIKKGSSPSLVITIGVSSEEETKNLVSLSDVKTIHIDKNPMNTLGGDVSIVDPSFSSLSEIVTALIMDLDLAGDVDAFQNLMDGIVAATRNFTLPQTSAFAFEAAGFLLQNGAKRKQRDNADRPRDNRFPSEQHFLNQKPNFKPQNNSSSRNSFDPSVQTNVQTQPVQQNTPQSNAREATVEGRDMTEDLSFTEGSTGTEVPDDWFLPKVFKGSKKGN